MTLQLPLANIITLGVADFDLERDFHRRPDRPLALDTADFDVFDVRGALLALFGIDDLGRDAHAAPERGRGGIRSSIIIITVDRPEEVDELAEGGFNRSSQHLDHGGGNGTILGMGHDGDWEGGDAFSGAPAAAA